MSKPLISGGLLAVNVFAGHDQTICYDSHLLMNNLGASISGDVNDGEWFAMGDGYFYPGGLKVIRFSEAIAQNAYYVPGPLDIVSGGFNFLLMSDLAPGNPRVVDDVMIRFQHAPPLLCTGNLNITLDQACTQVVTVSMVTPSPVAPVSNYTLRLLDNNGNPIPNNRLTKEHVNTTITYQLGHLCSSATCWGTIFVQDYFPPIFACKHDTIFCNQSHLPKDVGFPIPLGAKIDTLINGVYHISNWDACGIVRLSYTDELIKGNCTFDLDKIIIRRWVAFDMSNNRSNCTQNIVIKRLHVDQVVFPPNYDNIQLKALECGTSYIKLPNGNPSPDTTGRPTYGGCAHFEVSYSDLEFEACGAGVKLVRNWLLIEWCAQTFHNHNQIILIKDTQKPTISCVEKLTLYATPTSCANGSSPIPPLNQIIDCSQTSVSYGIVGSLGQNYNNNILDTQGLPSIVNLPVGDYTLYYIVSDACDNVDTCRTQLEVIDLQAPFPVCNLYVKVSLNQVGTGRIFASSFDQGSSDNCAIATIAARRMTHNCGPSPQDFSTFVDFCCNDIGTPVMVEVRYTDVNGNTNSCMVEVEIEDKLPPTVTAPPNITIACTESFDISNLSKFGKVVSNPTLVQPIVINNPYHQGIVGYDGLASDNCSVTIKDTAVLSLNCAIGTIVRTFTVTDRAGLKASAQQTITISNPRPIEFNEIEFPKKYEGDGCLSSTVSPNISGRPTYKRTACSQLASTFEDLVFNDDNGVCHKILRSWTVIDWCQHAHDPNTGKWGPVIQIIELSNKVEPEIISSCSDTIICSFDARCGGTIVNLSAKAKDDCTPQNALKWRYAIDLFSDNNEDINGFDNNFSHPLPIGEHTVFWSVTDDCGNSDSCSRIIHVEDCKNPTLYCLGSLTISLDEFSKRAEVWAKDFDLKSEDNCTSSEELIFTFNGAIPLLGQLQTPHYFEGNQQPSDINRYNQGIAQYWLPTANSSAMSFGCESIPDGRSAVIKMTMTVIDKSKNIDSCHVSLVVQDNHNHCPDVINFASISGTITTENGVVPRGLKVKALGVEKDWETTVNEATGRYLFDSLPTGTSYTLIPLLETKASEGLSTLDLILIRRHILEIERFNSPSMYVAADANASRSISVADISELRKIVLGSSLNIPKFPTGWEFISKSGIAHNLGAPFLYDKTAVVDFLAKDIINMDFLAVKIGDVNLSFDANLDGNKVFSRSKIQLNCAIEYQSDRFHLIIFSDEDISYDGLQLYFEGDIPMDNLANIDNNTYIYHGANEFLHLVQYFDKSKVIAANTPLVSIPLVQAFDLSKIKVSNSFQSEIYANDQIIPLDIVNVKMANSEMQLSILSSPFSHQFTFALENIESPSTMELTITDVQGKMWKKESHVLSQGSNMFSMDTHLWPNNMYILQVKSNGRLLSAKVLKLE